MGEGAVGNEIQQTNRLRGISQRTNYTDRTIALVGEVSTNFCG
jgi:hypothetical protein